MRTRVLTVALASAMCLGPAAASAQSTTESLEQTYGRLCGSGQQSDTCATLRQGLQTKLGGASLPAQTIRTPPPQDGSADAPLGAITDATGDAGSTSAWASSLGAGYPAPDIKSARAYTDGERLTLEIRFVAETFDPARTRATFTLSLDGDRSTGVKDGAFEGQDGDITVGGSPATAVFYRLSPTGDSYLSQQEIGSQRLPDGYIVEVPLAVLGAKAPADIEWQVAASIKLDSRTTTGIVDAGPGSVLPERWVRLALTQSPPGASAVASAPVAVVASPAHVEQPSQRPLQSQAQQVSSSPAAEAFERAEVATAPAEAATLYEQACEGGYAAGCTMLARIYMGDASGRPRDDARAFALFQSACQAGNARGCNGVGVLYEGGVGVARDIHQAVAYYHRACDAGWAGSCQWLGTIYTIGSKAATRVGGISENPARAAAASARACSLDRAKYIQECHHARHAADRAEKQERSGGGGGILRGAVGAALGVAAATSAGANAEQTLGAAAKGVALMNPESEGAAVIGNAGDILLQGGAAVPTGSGGVGGQATFTKKANLAVGSWCGGFTMQNYRTEALKKDADVQIRTMCGQAFEYYNMYENAIRQGYSEADCNRTYAAHEGATRNLKAFIAGFQ